MIQLSYFCIVILKNSASSIVFKAMNTEISRVIYSLKQPSLILKSGWIVEISNEKIIIWDSYTFLEILIDVQNLSTFLKVLVTMWNISLFLPVLNIVGHMQWMLHLWDLIIFYPARATPFLTLIWVLVQ